MDFTKQDLKVMKNIHILRTNKPSRLYKFANELYLDNIPKEYYKKYNIYITSNEEIKIGDYGYDQVHNCVVRITENLLGNYLYKKIILTTDVDLIKDGVQAINDEFLEWFVQIPSCEEVEVVDDTLTVKEMSSLPLGTRNHKYKIIIPKEEPKKETFEKATITAVRLSEHLDAKEQAMFVAGFEECIKWQNSQNGGLYNEEDLKQAFIVGKYGGLTQTYYDFDEWFNQFKNKTQ